MIKVLLAEKLSQKALELLKEIPEFEIDIKTDLSTAQLKEVIPNYEAIVVRNSVTLGRDVLEHATSLKVILKAGIDLYNIDVVFAESRNIEVRNTPFATSITVAEYTIAQMLGIARFIGPAYQSMKANKWERELFQNGSELFGKTAGIIGFGRIGQEVAKRQLALGMKVIYNDIIEIKTEIDAKPVTLKKLLKNADFISIHLPLTDTTKNLLSAKEFAQMKSSAVLINTARHSVVDENRLLTALNENKIKAVAIDVRENEQQAKQQLIAHDKVFPAPFLGTSTVEGQNRAGLDVISELKDFFNV
ncbi:MAG: 3-phosphoglycerate dehydrogenase [bacterium]|nr:3-phosphoglycerate dehydrogenase [bacterium]